MDQLVAGASELGLTLTPDQLDALAAYERELLDWNERFNLTAIRDPQQIRLRHFLDSFTCLLALAPRRDDGGLDVAAVSGSAIDVGSGAGFPGLPLRLVCPNLRLTLAESVGKKARFLEHLVSILGLQGVVIALGRAEDLARLPAHRDRYDYALARALAPLPTLLEYCLPFLRPGGLLVAPKKGDLVAEVAASQAALRALRGRWLPALPVHLAQLPDQRELLRVEKEGPTPAEFPRRAGLPGRQPIGSKASRVVDKRAP
ncbi:MAG: 16S rRNA (guanine(527)-N(7))-methyltransferase RsmG [Chloroflexi bacterium]|nr:16S rRNA (guanine(527)-N(7))-methyltransferase RsmG [Chloroflexota bacterium]MCL5108499.1 16S rRNA (guanine(527)-N(7))-methyltransferase RsmG [Chloroflexota bacterium]